MKRSNDGSFIVKKHAKRADSGLGAVAALAVAEQDAAFGLVRLGVGVNDDDDCLGLHVAHAYYHVGDLLDQPALLVERSPLGQLDDDFRHVPVLSVAASYRGPRYPETPRPGVFYPVCPVKRSVVQVLANAGP